MTSCEATPWPFYQKALFRFVFLYLTLYILNFIPFVYDVGVPWVGSHVLHLAYPITVKPNGSGDTTYNYVQVLMMLVMATGGSLIWSLLDRGRKHYRLLWAALRVVLRYQLAIVMISYGYAKVFKSQFPDLALSTLLQSYGESSPMGLIWNFMGYSSAYNLFTGGLEVLGGLLLFWRRTTLLGALLSLGVMTHVFVMNLCFDIPVKLMSFHLVLMLLVLLAPDLQRCLDFFLLNRPIAPRPAPEPPKRPRLAMALRLLKTAWIACFLTFGIVGNLRMADASNGIPLYGLYEVESFKRQGQELSFKDAGRWDKLVVEWPGYATVKLSSGLNKVINFAPALGKRQISVSDPLAKRPKDPQDLRNYPLTFRLRHQGFVIQGSLAGAPVEITLKQLDDKDFPLLKRGFHWINEYPYNR